MRRIISSSLKIATTNLKEFKVIWIFLITIIEIMTNAYALGAAHPSGPLGVVMEIFMFGIANVGIAFLLGCYIWRYFNHVSPVKNAFAAILALP